MRRAARERVRVCGKARLTSPPPSLLPADAADFSEWTIDEPFDGARIENPVPAGSAPREEAAGDGSYDIKKGPGAAQKVLDAGRA